MYDVVNFVKPVPYNPERSGEYIGVETQDMEFFRYARNQSLVAELVRERLNATNVEVRGCARVYSRSPSRP